MNREELNKACEIVRDLANEHFGDWEQSCKFEDKFRKAMSDKTNPTFERCLANVNPETREEIRRNMDYADWTEKACEFLEERLYPTVKVLNEDLVDVIDRWELIDEFRKAMGAVVKESLTTNLTWEDIRRIVEIADQMIQTAHDRVEWEDKSEEAYYTEVLRKFKEERK